MTSLEVKRGILLGVALGLLGSLIFSCAKHFEAKVEASHTIDTTEPIAVPRHFDFKGWSWFRPVMGAPAGILTPPTVVPVPMPDMPDAGFPFYFEGHVDYGDPQPKKTHDALGVNAESEGDSKPSFSLLGFLGLNWIPAVIIGVIVLLIVALLVFRKSGLVQRLAKTLPFPFSLLAIALPAPAETPKE